MTASTDTHTSGMTVAAVADMLNNQMTWPRSSFKGRWRVYGPEGGDATGGMFDPESGRLYVPMSFRFDPSTRFWVVTVNDSGGMPIGHYYHPVLFCAMRDALGIGRGAWVYQGELKG